MTNYNERLDEVFETLNNKAREERASCTERNNWEGYNSAYERLENEAKQAITSLTKEMVAEAKPEIKAHPLGAKYVKALIRTEKLKLLAEVRERVIGEVPSKMNTDNWKYDRRGYRDWETDRKSVV